MKRYQETNKDNIKYLKVYHGTNSSVVHKIKKNGLISINYDSSKWYMVSSTITSAIFHSTLNKDKHLYAEMKFPFVIEFTIPYIEIKRKWEGYPYLWKPRKTSKFDWYALRQPIPSKFITKIIPIKEKTWNYISDKGF